MPAIATARRVAWTLAVIEENHISAVKGIDYLCNKEF
jgi:hypothetical protein